MPPRAPTQAALLQLRLEAGRAQRRRGEQLCADPDFAPPRPGRTYKYLPERCVVERQRAKPRPRPRADPVSGRPELLRLYKTEIAAYRRLSQQASGPTPGLTPDDDATVMAYAFAALAPTLQAARAGSLSAGTLAHVDALFRDGVLNGPDARLLRARCHVYVLQLGTTVLH